MNCLFVRRRRQDSGIPVSITGAGNATVTYAEYNGIRYTSPTEFSVHEGDSIFMYSGNPSPTLIAPTIWVNRQLVVQNNPAQYTWVVPAGTKTITIKLNVNTRAIRLQYTT